MTEETTTYKFRGNEFNASIMEKAKTTYINIETKKEITRNCLYICKRYNIT